MNPSSVDVKTMSFQRLGHAEIVSDGVGGPENFKQDGGMAAYFAIESFSTLRL